MNYWELFELRLMEEANQELQLIADEQRAQQVEVELDAEFVFEQYFS